MATDLQADLRVPSELLQAIRSLPATREVVHCQTSFQVPVFAVYGECPVCGTRMKVRSFSAEPEIEDVFDAVFEWMSPNNTRRAALERIAEIGDEVGGDMRAASSARGEPSNQLSDKQRWEAVKKRRPIGTIIPGEVVRVEQYGAIFNIGERFLAVVDRLDLADEDLVVGSSRFLKIVQHADWNMQIRAAFASNRESFIAAASGPDCIAAAQLADRLLRFRDEFQSLSPDEQTKIREGLWHLATGAELLGIAPGELHSVVERGEDHYDEEGNLTFSAPCERYSPKVLLQAVDAWKRGEEYLPKSLVGIFAKKVPEQDS